ncbi:hypothetical protein ACJX0J_039263 [Zea mays]
MNIKDLLTILHFSLRDFKDIIIAGSSGKLNQLFTTQTMGTLTSGFGGARSKERNFGTTAILQQTLYFSLINHLLLANYFFLQNEKYPKSQMPKSLHIYMI